MEILNPQKANLGEKEMEQADKALAQLDNYYGHLTDNEGQDIDQNNEFAYFQAMQAYCLQTFNQWGIEGKLKPTFEEDDTKQLLHERENFSEEGVRPGRGVYEIIDYTSGNPGRLEYTKNVAVDCAVDGRAVASDLLVDDVAMELTISRNEELRRYVYNILVHIYLERMAKARNSGGKVEKKMISLREDLDRVLDELIESWEIDNSAMANYYRKIKQDKIRILNHVMRYLQEETKVIPDR